MSDQYVGKRIRLTRDIPNLWAGTVIAKDREGVVKYLNSDGDLYAVRLDGDPLPTWLGPGDFMVLAEPSEAQVFTPGTITVGEPQPWSWLLQDQVGHVMCQITPSLCLNFGPNISIDYGVDPPKVELRGAEPEAAAKAFWNAVHAVIGREPLFP